MSISDRSEGTKSSSVHNEWNLFEALGTESETSQADLAARAGVAVGTVNWYLKKWSAKGYVKIKWIDRWCWSYLLTPEGISRKATLAKEYVEASMSLYRRTRDEARRLLNEVKNAGYDQVCIEGDGEIEDVCRLTCIEMGILSHQEENLSSNPILKIDGASIWVRWPDSSNVASYPNRLQDPIKKQTERIDSL